MGKNKSRAARNAPKLMSQTITQSVSIGDQWDSAAFAKLLQEQAKSNETAIKQLEVAMGSASANQQQLAEQIAQSTMMKDIKDVLIAQLQDKKFSEAKERAIKLKEQEKIRIKEANDALKENIKIRADEAKAIGNLAKSVASLKTFSERMQDVGKKLKDGLSPSNMKIAALSKMNFMGIFSKAIDKEKFIKAQRASGATGSRAELAEKFEGAYKTSRGIQAIDKEFAEKQKESGLSASEYAKTIKGQELKKKRGLLAEEHANYDVRAQYLRQGTPQGTPTEQFAEKGASEEKDIEEQKAVAEQSDLLKKIEANTAGDSPDQKAKPKEEEKGGGGLLGNLMGGGGAGKAIKGLKDFGVGMVVIAGALWVAAKAFQEFAEVAWEDVGKGVLALGGLVAAALVLDKVKGNIIKGALALGVLELALWGMAKAMLTFHEVEWEDMAKAAVAIVGFSAAMFALGALLSGPQALVFAAGVAAIAGMGAAVWVLGKGMQAAGEGITQLVDGLKQLDEISGENLLKVAAGMTAIGVAFAAFGAGQAVAGLSNLATKFFSVVSGQKTPVEQLIEIGQHGEGVEKAGIGMEKLSAGMKAFSEIKSGSLKQLKEFPWEEATKFVAANGSMSVDSAKVYNASKENADENAKAEGNKGGGTTVVNAPVNNVQNTTNQTMRPAIRNHEPSWKRQYRGTVKYSNDF